MGPEHIASRDLYVKVTVSHCREVVSERLFLSTRQITNEGDYNLEGVMDCDAGLFLGGSTLTMRQLTIKSRCSHRSEIQSM